MRVRGIDAVGDWTFGNGNNNYKKNIEAVSQNTVTRLRSLLGDCFFSLKSGIDWYNILGTKDQKKLQLIASSTILNTSGIISILDFKINRDKKRGVFLEFSVSTIYGIQNNLKFSLGNIDA